MSQMLASANVAETGTSTLILTAERKPRYRECSDCGMPLAGNHGFYCDNEDCLRNNGAANSGGASTKIRNPREGPKESPDLSAFSWRQWL